MAIVYANESKTRDAGAGDSWTNYSSSGSSHWVSAGGISSNHNYYAWFGFPKGFIDPDVYEITSAMLYFTQGYLSYAYAGATDTVEVQCGKLTPSGTNGINSVVSTDTFTSSTNEPVQYSLSFLPGAKAIQNGTADGILISISFNHKIYIEFDAHAIGDNNRKPRIVYDYKLRRFYCIPHTTDSNKGTISGGGTTDHGSTLTITAYPRTGYHFVRWQKADGSEYSTSNPLTLTANVNMPTDLYAVFDINIYSVGVGSLGHGSVFGSGTYIHGSTCAASATPDTGYHFVEWQDLKGSRLSTNNPYKFTVTNSVAIRAKFDVNTYDIGVVAIGDKGSSSVSGGGTYNYGSTAKVVANPATGYRFVKWVATNNVDDSAVSTSTSYSFTVTSARTLYAVFEKHTYIVSVSVGSGQGSVSGEGAYAYNDYCRVTASPDVGYKFVHWEDNDGNQISTHSNYTFVVTSNITLKAIFTLIDYNVSLNFAVNNSDRGVLSGSGTYHYNEVITIKAIPNSGYKFVGWSSTSDGNNIVTSADETQTITVTSDITYYAVFKNNSAIHVLNESTSDYDLYLPFILTEEGNWVQCETYINVNGQWKLCIS